MPKVGKKKRTRMNYRDVHLASCDIIQEVPGKTVSVTQTSENKNPFERHVLHSHVMRTDSEDVLRLQITIDWNVHEFILDGRIPMRVKFVDLLRTPEKRKAPTYLVSQWHLGRGYWHHLFQKQRGVEYCPEDDPDLNAE